MVAMFIGTNSYPLTTTFEATGNYRIYAKRVGLNNPFAETTSGSIQLNISGSPVKAFLYWIERDFYRNGVDDTITFQKHGLSPINITGTLIGSDAASTRFRADIKSYVTTGSNTFTLSGLNNKRNPGAGILIIVEDATLPVSKILLKDGCDFFYYGIAGQENSELISFNFDASTFDRSGKAIFFVADAQTETETIRGNEIAGYYHQ